MDAVNREKTERVMARIRERLATPLHHEEIARSRIDDRTHDIRFQTDLRRGPAEAVFDVLSQAATLSRALHTTGPIVEPSGAITFDIVAPESFTVPGLTWFHVEVRH